MDPGDDFAFSIKKHNKHNNKMKDNKTKTIRKKSKTTTTKKHKTKT